MKNNNAIIGCGIAAFLIVAVFMMAVLVVLIGKGGDKKMGGVISSVSGQKIGLMYVTGVITSGKSSAGGFMGGEGSSGSDSIVETLREASEDSSIKAILIRINSPGGSAAASQEVFNEIMRIRKETKKKVVISVGDMAASGGYYIAAAGDAIVANPASITGSIGVIMKYMNYEGLMGKVGMEAVVLKSGKLKDMGSPYRQMTQEERDIMQSALGNIHEQFIADVAKGRKMKISDVREVADGRILTGEQAMGAGLVDDIGGLEDAIAITGKMAGLGDSPEVEHLQKESPFSIFLNSLSGIKPDMSHEKTLGMISNIMMADPLLMGGPR